MESETKKKILIFSYHQFGQLVDSIKYCQYSNGLYDITYLGWDYGKNKIDINGVLVKYISREGNLIKRNLRLIWAAHKEIKVGRFDIVFMHYTCGISMLRLLHKNVKMIFDVRTLAINTSKVRRLLFNNLIQFESRFFKNHSIISEGIASSLKLKSYSLLPLGAEPIKSIKRKKM